MKRIFTFLFILFVARSYAQINAGTDDTICSGSATLTATLTSASPTNVSLSDDIFSGVVNIGFSFTFYGNTYTQCVISSNNYISFNIAQAGGYSPWSITAAVPSTADPMNATMGPWQDINPGIGGTVRYATVGTAPNRIFVVEYCNVPMFSCTSMNFSSQIQLHENGSIVETHIINKPLCTTWNGGKAIHAMHNSNGTLADVVPGRNNPTQWTANLEGMRFTPNGPNAFTIATIPFNPVVLGASGTINWAQVGGGSIGTGATVTVSPTNTTSYVASIQDLCSGAIFQDTVTVVVNSPFNFNGSFTNISSCTQTTGSATVIVNNGSGNYTYQWDANAGSQTTATATNLGGGSYTVSVTDNTLGCISDTTLLVGDSNNLAISVISQDDISCFGANDGEATVDVVGSNGNYSVLWSNGETAAAAVALTPGTNTATVTDLDGCTGQISVVITQPQPLISNMSYNDVPCFGQSTGNADVTVSGGNGAPYIYQWDDPSAQTSSSATGLPAGNYTVTITDSEGCSIVDSVTITSPTQITGSISSQNISCNGLTDGSATYTVNGGVTPYTYYWPLSGSTSNTETNMIAGTYVVIVTDANGCSISDTVTITQPTVITLTYSVTDAECGLSDGSITTNPTGGTGPYTYQWDSNAGNQTTQTANGLAMGNYSVTVTDANGCTASGSASVGEYFNTVAGLIANPVTGVYPLDVNFTNTSTNGTTFEWIFGDGNTQTVTNTNSVTNTYVLPGTYTAMLIVYNAGGCSDTTYVTIEVLNNSTLIMPNVFSPNNDAVNEVFMPIYQYITEYSMTITNRWGKIMFTTDNIANGWNGKNQSNGSDCADGTYYYLVKAVGIDNIEYNLSGHLTLVR